MSLGAGGTVEEFAMWMDHQEQLDHHDTLLDHVEWLHRAGFVNVDCVWRCLLWAIVYGQKNGRPA